ncbi:DoxX family protein [Chitinophaga nivalis]|uniref:DoxX family protein n=1 Tax=Chitinophaga nivalis TaxID=2991709 RepID=A0ABT3ITE6_9BACT|nr:DoxX family protein [Chitinophaga nivalis]MCW3463062.1 DoxX family protein [Chitinophaga nivalis]MCW3487248.1 DoxX family protein [Chitinophaga nivalis]
MFKRLLQTDHHLTSFIIRITVALVMLPHGAQKLLGMFGGYGFKATMNFFTSNGTPAILAFMVIMTESIGALLILLGFTTRIWAALLTVIMLVAISMHAANGFFMNWGGTQAGEGFEYHLLVIGINLALVIKGAGRWSIDGKLTNK